MESNRYKLLSDQELAGLFRKERDAAAFEELFFRHKNGLYTYARRFFSVLPPDRVKELVREAFIRAFIRPPSRGAAPFKNFLYGIITPLGLKRQKALMGSPARPEERPPAFSPSLGDTGGKRESSPANEEIRALISRELGKTDGRSRELLLLKFFDGMSCDGMAQSARISVRAVRSGLGRAFVRISQKLRKEGIIDPVRKCGRINTGILFDYAFEILDGKHKKDIQAHVRRCPSCRGELKKILTVRFVLKNTSPFAYEEDFRLLLKEAEERGRSMSWTERMALFSDRLAEKLAFFKRFRIRFEYVLATGFLFLLLSGLMVFLHSGDYLYVALAQGDVMVNGKPFSRFPRSRYSMKTPLNILTGKGRCVLQVSGGKLITVLEDSDVILKQEKEGGLLIHREGEILCRVKDLKGQDRFLIRSSGAELRVPGALLYVKNAEGLLEAGVREGRISAFFKEKLLDVNAGELLLAGKTRMRTVPLTEKKSRIFSGINSFPFLSEPSRRRLLLIKGEPAGSRVYRGYRLLGQAPLYILASVSEKEKYTAAERSYQPAVMSYTGQDVLAFKLNTLKQPRMTGKFRLPAALSASPLAVEHCLILPGRNGAVYKMNLETRKVNWAFRTGKSVSTVPLYENNAVYFASRDGFFYALDYITGEKLWKKRVGPSVSPRPLIHGGRIYFGTPAGMLYELDLKTGNILWSRKFAKGFSSSPAVRENLLFIGSEDRLLYAVHLEDKEIIWTFAYQGRMAGAPPLPEGPCVYFSSGGRTVYAVETLTGRLKWKTRADAGGLSSPVLLDGLLVAVSSRGRLYALEAEEGGPVWSSAAEYGVASDPVALAPSFILLHDGKKRLHLFNAWGQSGTVFPYAADYFLADGKRVLLFDRNNVLYVFSVERD